MIQLYEAMHPLWKNLEKWFANDPFFLDLILCIKNDSIPAEEIRKYSHKDRQKILNDRYHNRQDFHKHFTNVLNDGWKISEMLYPNVAVIMKDLKIHDPFECQLEMLIDFKVGINTQLSPERDCLNCEYENNEIVGKLARALSEPFDFIKTVDGEKCSTDLFAELRCAEVIQNKGCDKEFWSPWDQNMWVYPDYTKEHKQDFFVNRPDELLEFTIRKPVIIEGFGDEKICGNFLNKDCKNPNTCFASPSYVKGCNC